MKQNIYDNETFFTKYETMRNDKNTPSANDLIEIPNILKMLPDLTNKRVLELSCGSGENIKYFLEHGASFVYATDVSHKMIDLAKQKNSYENVKIEVMAMEDISLINEKFDVIISSLAIHYIEDYDKLCSDIYQLLVPGGYFVYSQEHPIGTGTKLTEHCYGEDKLFIDDKYFKIVSDYNRNGKRIVDWNDCKVVKYHRNFSYIINTLLKNQFHIIEFLEPVPTNDIIKLKPSVVHQFDVPYFLFIKVQKES